MLNELTNAIAQVLEDIFQMSLDSSELPADRRKANIDAVVKEVNGTWPQTIDIYC